MLKKLSASLQLVMVLLFTVFATGVAPLAKAYADDFNTNQVGATTNTNNNWDWQYDVTCTGVSGNNPHHGDSIDSNIRIKNLDTGIVQTFNYHGADNGTGGQFTYSLATDYKVPASWTHYEIQWVQVNGTNYHWQGSKECGNTPQPTLITPGAVTFTEGAVVCSANQAVYTKPSYTVPATAHVIYKNGIPVTAGTYAVEFGSSVTITAVSADSAKYTLTGGAKWDHDFASKPVAPDCTPCVSTIHDSDIKAQYVTDDFHATVQYVGVAKLCADAQKTVSLNSYGTDGPTWATSGTQKFVDHDQVTISASNLTGNLAVKQPKCYYQTDLYFGSTKYDGVDGPLPHYNDVAVPAGLIDHRNSGQKCQPPKQEVTPAAVKPVYPTCKNPRSSGFTIEYTKGVYYTASVNGGSSYPVIFENNHVPVGSTVTVTAHALPGYTLQAGATASWTFTLKAVNPNDCVTPPTPPTGVCKNIDGIQTDVPAGYGIDDDGNCVAGGKGGDDTEEVDTTAAQVLGITTPTTKTAELANTGADTSTTLLTMLLGFTVISLALGSTFAVRKQRS